MQAEHAKRAKREHASRTFSVLLLLLAVKPSQK